MRTVRWKSKQVILSLIALFVVAVTFYNVSDVHVSRTQKAERENGHCKMHTLHSDVSSESLASFDDGRAKTLVILTYQRSGSTFIGEMFNKNPDAFYLFEPLDALYVSMYGLNHGWSVPSDITHYWNGTHREIPEAEINAIVEFLDHFLSCDINSLPTEALIHNFWSVHRRHFLHLTDYIHCIQSNNLTFPVCEDVNPFKCGKRFGQIGDENMYKTCRESLWDRRYSTLQTGSSTSLSKPAVESLMNLYAERFRCLDGIRQKLDRTCSSVIKDSCQRKLLRVVKATRASMTSVDAFLRHRIKHGDKNVRIIHSYRDPRAVAISRVRQGDPLLGKFASFALDSDSNEAALREARMYCRTAVDDFRYREKEMGCGGDLVMSLDYDQAVFDVVGTIQAVYRFMGIKLIPPTVENWANEAARMSREISLKWRKYVSSELSDRIMALDDCIELCRYIGCRNKD